MKQLSIIIPVKNEENNLPKLIEKLSLTFSNKSIDYELIVVVDKSTDRTLEIAQEYSQKYPIKIHQKLGKPGKAFSILEGIELAEAENIGFIDGDLQYPPSAIPGMLDLLNQDNVGVVVANRKTYKSASVIRKIGSRANRLFFGKLLLGLDCDVQSGLKLFKKEIYLYLDKSLVTAWTIDMPLLTAAKELGYDIAQKDITFETRENGASHIGFLKAGYAIAKCALKIRFRTARIHEIQLEKDLAKNPTGTSIAFKGNRFTVHNSLSHEKSSILTFTRFQKSVILTTLALGFAALFWQPMPVLITITAVLSFIYFADVIFTAVITAKSLHFPPEISVSDEELNALNDNDLPIYTILCPLYKEAAVLQHYIDSMEALEWPKSKLDVLLLLEEDDHETIQAAQNMSLPDYVKITIVPHSMPKTKPKACNFGLHHAKGGYAVIYDAEDKPDPLQLKKAYLGFQKASTNTVCIQAKLNYYNSRQNLLTKLFTAEYSLWFDVILPGLQSIETLIPLGGTSNHFDLHKLRMLEGWDAFNVTEDCDLGVRLFKDGYKTAIVDSTTYEEANSNVHNWIRQRSRWLKGYLQTYFVHMRHPIAFFRKHGWHALLFQLVIGLRISFILINPILWATTIAYFTLNQYVGTFIQSLYPGIVFYMAFFALVFGNFLYLYNYMIGLAKKEQWGLIKYVFFVPFYWLLMSVAAVKAFYQLFVKPHYWEKTHHGLHLDVSKTKSLKFNNRITKVFGSLSRFVSVIKIDLKIDIPQLFKKNKIISGGTILIAATMLANIMNYLYNAILSRKLDLEEFSIIGLIGSLSFFASIPIHSLTRTVAYKTGILFGKYKQVKKDFWSKVTIYSIAIGFISVVIWISAIPFFTSFFNLDSALPLILFTPVWLFSLLFAVNYGFLEGNLKFSHLGALLIIESISKLILTWVFLELNLHGYIYASVALSTIIVYFASLLLTNKIIRSANAGNMKSAELNFPFGFYNSSLLLKISVVTFLSLDIMLAKHFMSSSEAGAYTLISLIGKMIFFINGVFSQFLVSLVSTELGANLKGKRTFYQIMALGTISGALAYILLGLFGEYTAPILVGKKILPYIDLLKVYGLGVFAFSIAQNIIGYKQIKNNYSYIAISVILTFAQIIGFYFYHDNLQYVVNIMFGIGLLNLVLCLSLFIIENLLSADKKTKAISHDIGGDKKLRILFLNWRDTKHTWAGGAEVYIHELGKKLVENGHTVTLFCSNDKHNPTKENLDGIRIIRKGGFFTVYLWAFLYYFFAFRGRIDVIIDSENGIPFFSPLYAKEPVIGLIHHVHQEIILDELKLAWYLLPLAYLAKQLETKVMPYVYKNVTMITVSQSTKMDMEWLGFGTSSEINLVHPGIEPQKFANKVAKTKYPSILYLGRLKPYKHVETLIFAMEDILKAKPRTKLSIAGAGESRQKLEKLVKKLNLQNSVNFLGKVTETDKTKLMSESWVFAYPSAWEGWGISVIEANAAGTPVVASNVPGLKDSVKNPHSGYLVTAKNPKEFAEKITLILTDRQLRKSLSSTCIDWALNFTWEKSAKKLEEIIKYKI